MKSGRRLSLGIIAGDKTCTGADDPSRHWECHLLGSRGQTKQPYCELFGVHLQHAYVQVGADEYELPARCADCRKAEEQDEDAN